MASAVAQASGATAGRGAWVLNPTAGVAERAPDVVAG